MQKIFAIEARGQRVLTSAQIAECYGTTVDCIKQNFHANKTRFVEGKHYIALIGTELKDFKNKVRIPYLAESKIENEVRIPHSAEVKARYQFNTSFKYAKSLYLWTEKGALLHAKSLNTDKAWEVYDYLVDFYFRAQEKQPEPVKKEPLPPNPMMRTVVDIPENPEAQETIREIKKALAAVEVMLDESDRYVSKDVYCRYQDGISDALQALMIRVQRYLSISPRLIEKIF